MGAVDGGGKQLSFYVVITAMSRVALADGYLLARHLIKETKLLHFRYLGVVRTRIRPASMLSILPVLVLPEKDLTRSKHLRLVPQATPRSPADLAGFAITLLANAGSAAQRQVSIDPRNYGVKGSTALFERTKLFEIVKAESGHPYVADRRNKARALQPGL